MYLRNTNISFSIFQALNLHCLRQFWGVFSGWNEKKILYDDNDDNDVIFTCGV